KPSRSTDRPLRGVRGQLGSWRTSRARPNISGQAQTLAEILGRNSPSPNLQRLAQKPLRYELRPGQDREPQLLLQQPSRVPMPLSVPSHRTSKGGYSSPPSRNKPKRSLRLSRWLVENSDILFLYLRVSSGSTSSGLA